MVRNLCAVVVLVAGLGQVILAETYLEKVTAVDADKKTITIAVDKKEKALPVDDKADIQQQVRAGKRLRVTPVKGGLKGIKAGSEVTLTTEKKDGREVVTKIVVLAGEGPKGK